MDTGVEYEPLGNQTKIPAVDAGEHEITASFYTDNQTAMQKQNGETTNYSYDPAGRTEKTVSEGSTKATVVNHYPGAGEAISWACEEAAKECEEGKGTKWTRNIPGIDGSLAATQHNSEAAILQLHDLQGNIVATAAVSETETKLLTTYNPTEFGVPVNGTPPTKFSWLGADGLATETSSGAANPGGGSYVPQLGRPLQTEPVEPPGAYANGSYNGMPYTTGVSAQSETLGSDLAAGAPEREASRLAAAKKFEEEEQRARERAELEARLNAPTPTEGGAEVEPYTVDPSKLLTAGEAKILAYGLRYGGTFAGIAWPELGEFLEALEYFGVNAITEAAEKLERCYQPLYENKQTGDARCKAYVNLEFGFWPTSWGVEICWKKEYKRKNSVHITYPYCTPT